MGQSSKEMMITINGQVGSGASQVGVFLTQIGSTLDKLGGKTREFMKESLGVYQGYEDEMLAARYALSASAESTTQLEQWMSGLEESAQQWAASSIFHTDDVSRAINNAAHAGWDYQEILEGIPQAMLIAQAGGLDLSDGLDYLVKIMNSTKTPMSDIGTLVDQWAMAANSSATNIDEMGEAFMAMGATAQFGDNTAEIFSMLAALANVGTVGSQAGTALRSAMMRVVAPTTKAENAMELLGADADELGEVLADTNVTKAAKTLEGLGFSAYTSTGKLKPMRQIFSELFQLTEGLDEASKNEIMGAIFPSRTIATALSLLSASNGELDDLYDKISNSEGYAQKGADIMMSGVTGSMETLGSKWEEFQRSFGESMSPYVESIAGALSGFLDSLNNLPPEVMSGLTTMLGALSAAGPLLMGAGSIAMLAGFLGPVGSAAMAAGLGLSFLLGYAEKLGEIDFDQSFGTMELNLDEMNAYVDSLDTKFSKEKEAIEAWQQAVTEAQTKYEETVGTMNEGLLKKVLTGGEFTDADFQQFVQLGDDIVKWTQEGIMNAEARDLSLLELMFGSQETPEDAETFENLAGVLDYGYQDLYNEAYEIGENIRKQYTAALQNGELTAEDRAAIQAQISRLNEIQAEIAAGMSQDEYYAQQEKAGRVNWESVETFLKENGEKLKAENTAIDNQYDQLIGRVKGAMERARESGQNTITYKDLNGEERTINVSAEAEEQAVKSINAQREAAKQSAAEKYGGVSATAFDALMRDSDVSLAWDALQRAAAGESIESQIAGMSVPEAEALTANLTKAFQLYTSGNFGILKQFENDPTAGMQWQAIEQLNDVNMAAQRAQTALGELKLAQTGGAGAGEFNWEVDDEEVEDWTPPKETGEFNWEVDDEEVQNYVPPEKDGNVTYHASGSEMDGFAAGGRATEPSIFGEAGAEWAIPEQHSERTAELLNAARRASGFTWTDLLNRFGGLNANPGNQPVVLNYSPVINAGDASGVAGALAADKDKLLKMIRQAMDEARYRESVEVFA